MLTVAAIVLATTAPPAMADLDQDRKAAVLLARGGDPTAAAASLQRLHAERPADLQVRLDLAVVSAWAGDDPRTLALLEPLDPASLPTYVLAAYAKSARDLQRWALSESLYDRLIRREPGTLDHQLGKVLVLADAGRFEEAREELQRAEREAASSPARQARASQACGYIAERERRYTQALGCYERALALDPGLKEARRRHILVASALGATVKALEEARRYPGLLTAEETVRLELDAAAMRIRWADLPNPESSLQDARVAVDSHDDLIRRRGEGALAETSHPDALLLDRVAALAAAYEMADAIAVFESMQTSPQDLSGFPAYVLAAAGQAYLYLERPKEAVACFDAALALDPDGFDLKIGLFYALSDSHDFPRARALATELLSSEAPWKRPADAIWIANDRFPQAREIAVMELAFREEYEPALEDLSSMLAIAPANSSLRLARAQLMQWRGWNSRAQQELERIEATEPANVSGVILSGHAALETQKFRTAESATQTALQMAPYDKAALELGERWMLHNRPTLEMSAGATWSDGGDFDGNSWRADSYYFSKPLAYTYRWFAHDLVSYGKFDEGKGRDHRIGGGLEYRDRRVTARGELHQGIEQNEDPGASASVSWRQSDQLTWNALLAANTPNMPLRGTRIGVKANEAQMSTSYRWHESRVASAGAGLMDMDDDNRRSWLNLSFRQRVLNAPRHKLIASLRGYASRNTEDERVYYNPESDRELAAGLTHEWRISRRYDHALTQRFTAEAGSYWQENYGSSSIWTLSLEHDWELGPRAQVGYGFSWGGRAYDGDREHDRSLFLRLRGLL